MNNFTMSFKKFLTNKNTVTILGVVVIIFVLVFGYNYRVNSAIQPIPMPYAKQTIQPRTKITEEMIGITNVPPAMLKGSFISNPNDLIDKYTNVNALIPSGSLFYKGAIVPEKELPDSAIVDLPPDMIVYNFQVDIKSSYSNSIFPNSYVDVYFKAMDEDYKVIVGRLVKNIKVLAVKDSSGRHVFENTNENRISSTILLGVTEEINLLLRKAEFLGDFYEATLIIVPTNELYQAAPGELEITSTYLKDYINARSVDVPVDVKPEEILGDTPNATE